MFVRWFLGLPFAVVITAGLFFMMAMMISNPVVDIDPQKESPNIDILGDFTETPPDRTPITPPTITEEPPEFEPIVTAKQDAPGSTDFDFGPIDTPIEIIPGQGAFPTPIIQHPPPYPEACRSRGAEGLVLVQFDVTPEGNVVNPVVLESPDRCFNRTVIATISKWKYPPAYKNGRAVMKYGLVEKFSFQLT